jgi:hypothetical protein
VVAYDELGQFRVGIDAVSKPGELLGLDAAADPVRGRGVESDDVNAVDDRCGVGVREATRGVPRNAGALDCFSCCLVSAGRSLRKRNASCVKPPSWLNGLCDK